MRTRAATDGAMSARTSRAPVAEDRLRHVLAAGLAHAQTAAPVSLFCRRKPGLCHSSFHKKQAEEFQVKSLTNMWNEIQSIIKDFKNNSRDLKNYRIGVKRAKAFKRLYTIYLEDVGPGNKLQDKNIGLAKEYLEGVKPNFYFEDEKRLLELAQNFIDRLDKCQNDDLCQEELNEFNSTAVK